MKDVTPLLAHCSYVFLASTHRVVFLSDGDDMTRELVEIRGQIVTDVQFGWEFIAILTAGKVLGNGRVSKFYLVTSILFATGAHKYYSNNVLNSHQINTRKPYICIYIYVFYFAQHRWTDLDCWGQQLPPVSTPRHKKSPYIFPSGKYTTGCANRCWGVQLRRAHSGQNGN